MKPILLYGLLCLTLVACSGRKQIEKSLKFGDAKLREIQDRKRELTLLEQDILATKEKLVNILKGLEEQQIVLQSGIYKKRAIN